MKTLNKQQKITIGILGSIFVVVLVARIFSRREEGHIKRIIEGFATTASSIVEKPLPERVALIKNHALEFADVVGVHLTSGDEHQEFTFTPADFERNSIAAQTSLEQLTVALEAISVHVDELHATAHLQLNIVGAIKGGEGSFTDNWSVLLEFIKKDDNWLLKDLVGTNLRP